MNTQTAKKIEELDDVIGIADICEILSVSKSSVNRLLEGNQIKSFKVGSRRKITKKCFLDYLNTQCQ